MEIGDGFEVAAMGRRLTASTHRTALPLGPTHRFLRALAQAGPVGGTTHCGVARIAGVEISARAIRQRFGHGTAAGAIFACRREEWAELARLELMFELGLGSLPSAEREIRAEFRRYLVFDTEDRVARAARSAANCVGAPPRKFRQILDYAGEFLALHGGRRRPSAVPSWEGRADGYRDSPAVEALLRERALRARP